MILDALYLLAAITLVVAPLIYFRDYPKNRRASERLAGPESRMRLGYTEDEVRAQAHLYDHRNRKAS